MPTSLVRPNCSARNKLLNERPMAAASASAQPTAAKKKQGSGLCSIQCGHQSGQLKNTGQNQLKPAQIAILAPFPHNTSSPPFLQSRTIAQNLTQTHTNPSKTHKKSQNEGFYSTQTGQSQGHLAAVALPDAAIPQSAPVNKKRPPPSQSGQNSRNGRWPLACFAHCPIGSMSSPLIGSMSSPLS